MTEREPAAVSPLAPTRVVSPARPADDRRSLDDRDLPSRTDTIGAALSGVIGGPVGRHALIGRQRFLTPLRVMLIIALVFLALGYSTKAACLQTTGTGTADQRVGNWQNQRAYYELCYSDTVPLYTAELLNLGKFPYKSSWIETDSEGKPRTQYDGNIAVRYMEYPVLTGIYQYLSMALAKTYTALTKLVSVPIIAEVVMFFNIAAFGLALAWLTTVWASARLAGPRRIWDAALVAASPILIFQVFTNFDALATAFATGALLAWARRKPWLAGVLIGLGVAAKLYPLLLFIPLVILGLRTGRLREVGKTAIATVLTWLVVNLPIMVLFPRGWSEFFRLNTRRGDDMDSLYNVVKSFTGWRGFDQNLGFWQPPTVLNTVTAVLFVSCCVAITYIALTAKQRPRLVQVAFLVVAAFLLTNKVWSPQFSLWLVPLAVLALPHRRILLAWMTHRRAGVGAADDVPVRRAEPRPARAAVHHHRAAARHRGNHVVRPGDSTDLPTRVGPGAMPGAGRRPVGRSVRAGTRCAAGLVTRLVAPAGGPDPSDAGARRSTEPEDEPDFARST